MRTDARKTGSHTDMKKLTVAVRSFSNEPKNLCPYRENHLSIFRPCKPLPSHYTDPAIASRNLYFLPFLHFRRTLREIMLKDWIFPTDGGYFQPGFPIPLNNTYFYQAVSCDCLSKCHSDKSRPSISRGRELIQALGCDIHYRGALVLRAILVDL